LIANGEKKAGASVMNMASSALSYFTGRKSSASARDQDDVQPGQLPDVDERDVQKLAAEMQGSSKKRKASDSSAPSSLKKQRGPSNRLSSDSLMSGGLGDD